MTITITEALAEIKTLGKRVEQKRQSIVQYLARQDGIRDPLDKSGGSPKFIAETLQSVADLEDRLIQLRRGIQHANDTTQITVCGLTRSISEWLTWRRDVAPGQRSFYSSLRSSLSQVRAAATKQGSALVSATATTGDLQPTDFIVNVDEADINRQQELIEEILGTLDGQLSLKNATVAIGD